LEGGRREGDSETCITHGALHIVIMGCCLNQLRSGTGLMLEGAGVEGVGVGRRGQSGSRFEAKRMSVNV